MQFSYLSFSSLNHMERFGFSNTDGEMSSTAAVEEKSRTENKSFKVLGTYL